MPSLQQKFTLIVLLSFLILPGEKMSAQWKVTANVDTCEICAGYNVKLSAKRKSPGYPPSSHSLKNWNSINTSPIKINPCGLEPNGYHFWMRPKDSVPRALESPNIKIPGKGYVIDWWMRYGRDQVTGTCHAPDWPDEGIHVQYSTDNGTTWTNFPGPDKEPVGSTITGPPFNTKTPGSGGYWEPYLSPQDQKKSELYHWNRYKSEIPAKAVTDHTRFRFIQMSNSGKGYDTWGIDGYDHGMWSNTPNIAIYCPSQSQVNWEHGSTVLNPTSLTLPERGNAPYDTCFIVTISDSCTSDSDTVCVTVNPIPDAKIGYQWLESDKILYSDISNIPDSINYQRNWSLGSNATPSTSTDSSVKVTYTSPGTYQTTLEINSKGCKGRDELKAVITSNEEKQKDEKIQIYPTPSDGKLTIKIPDKETDKEISIQAFTAGGKQVLEKNSEYKKRIHLDLSDQKSGTYLIIIDNEQISMQKKVVIK